MALDLTMPGVLTYGVVLAYLGAAVALLCGWRRAGHGSYAFGFALAATAVVWRWYQVGGVPLQNLFGVFLCLGMLSYPLWLFCRRFLKIEGGATDPLLGLVVMFPAAFVFDAAPSNAPPALQSWLFLPHVGAYVLGYLVLFKATVPALAGLLGRAGSVAEGRPDYELTVFRLIRLAFPLLTSGLILGSMWGMMAWGSYWNWDPKELWGLTMWLLYLGYFQFRRASSARYPRANCAIALAGAAVIVITLMWVNLARIFAGLHAYVA